MDDYLVCSFFSRNKHDVLNFYSNFNDQEELILWMSQLPSPDMAILEVKGDSQTVVVIPTINSANKFPIRCREEIFPGLTIIFVESGKDGYFNLARSLNSGIKAALKFDPEWVVLSNDDMVRVDPVSKLIDQLNNYSIVNNPVLFPISHSSGYLASIGIQRRIDAVLTGLINRSESTRFKLEEKFNVRVKMIPDAKKLRYWRYRELHAFRNIGDFVVLKGSYLKSISGNLFDERYLSGVEDIDLSFRMYLSKVNYSIMNYHIEGIGKQSQGTGAVRWLRDIANFSLFNYKIDREFGESKQPMTLPK